MYTSQLVAKYKETVTRYRDKYEWNKDPETNLTVPGSGVGRVEVPASEDDIAIDHVLLAQNLNFIRREINIWRRFGWHLASQYSEDKGKPLFLDPAEREKMFMSRGLIAKLPRSEQFIFCNALLSSDIDGMIPLIESIDDCSSYELMDAYFIAVSKWYERKSNLELNPNKRYFYLQEKVKFAKSEKEGGYKRLHRESQIYPRLHFLSDVGFVLKNDSKYSLSNLGKKFKEQWSSLDDRAVFKLLDEKESNLGVLLAEIYGDGFNEMTNEQIENAFYKLSAFYKYIGLIMIPYEDLYFSMVAFALNSNRKLSFSTYRRTMEQLAKVKGFDLSTNIPGRRYIRT
jgi:hypothetical protein